MVSVGRGSEFLPNVSIEALETMYKEEKDVKAKLRLLCALHRKKNRTILEIADIVNLPKSTVSDYLRRLEADIKYRYDIKNKGAIPKLNKKQQEELREVLFEGPSKVGLPFVFWTTKLVHYYIKKRFRKVFTLHGIRKLLYRLGFSLQKPRQIHHKGDKEEQEYFKKNLDEELKTILEKDTRSSFWMRPRSY